MKYIRVARSSEHGTACVPVYDEKTGKITNIADKKTDTSVLRFLDDKRSNEKYTDVSGRTVKMVMTIDVADGQTETGTSTVEILNLNGNDLYVMIDGKAYAVYKGVVTLYNLD